ncbi:peptidoglycan DD-metalloendopeptidase family protein [Campylobacter canadensis]|uniref:Peptidoglycan DD-metalloendopeptidase family protein n=1 Tax=Campylobacter canadensis TaxID=449520 RepID=A0ABS7WRU6_9BACT|nr:peptidoglycan DD-metalloendopeptidase family protein [Campylobacter canadensis]MBZ7987464.1 peptidoglycan DD-metalloendopeptidase family protein [Campylobacter canadensis]MBZ7994807.1 peptidoglycan DD-metalloendopeptidase family protein [Campylobacter canadensis]MBZ7996408.1 peptidoglycan DD-metalloendopeptidase family protein [Campylobacter canadensis]MBZ7998442.1 peptidoglycan DD-metalloendopeptidase family protein [Campylobacter canadensis]MBZ8000156.1 peptidoglycan DD-metalloendopeptida
MFRILLLIFTIFNIFSFAKELKMEELVWERGDSFLYFLSKNQIPLSLYHNLDKEDKELTAEIIAGVKYQILRDENDEIEQILIPISEDLQIQLYKDTNNEFKILFSPISYNIENESLVFKVSKSVYQDIVDNTQNPKLASALLKAYANTINYTGMKKDDKVAIIYSQKRRLGKVYGDLDIKAAMVEVNKKPFYIFKYGDSDYYDKNARQLQSYTFILPVGNARISSPFNPGRFHPILKKYRAHLGIDYAAPIGTPVKAAGSGKIIFRGVKGGYGNVIQVSHNNGYMTLYAHLSRFGKYKVGDYVRQGQVIAYVGTTGLSTGPHLHFGMYKNNTAINPAKIVRVVKDSLTGKERQQFMQVAAEYEKDLAKAIAENKSSVLESQFENIVELK